MLRVRVLLPVLWAAVVLSTAACASPQVFGTYYFADKQFPQFMRLWDGGWSLATAEDPDYKPRTSLPLGGYVYVHFQNTGDRPLTVTDLAFQGVKLSEALGKSNDRVTSVDLPGCSIYLSKLPKSQIDKLALAGEPVWWKAEPFEVPSRGTGQIVLRLRHQPQVERFELTIETDAGSVRAVVDTRREEPRFEGISFTPGLDTVFLYLRHPKAGVKPDKILMDRKDVTSEASIAADPSVDICPVVLRLPQPIERMSYHSFQAVYPDGSTATAGIKAWGEDIVYGMWGSRGNAKGFLSDLAKHNVNVQMGMTPKGVAELSLSDDGMSLLRSLGIRQMATWFGNARKPIFFFLMDEPDAHEVEIDDLQKMDPVGCLGMGLVGRSEQLRAKDPSVPQLLNVDNTNKPENWYAYHQLTDIPCIDPYWTGELDIAYSRHPRLLQVQSKPTYVYAATKISQSSAAPKPLHVILCSTQYLSKDYKGRFPTPEEERIQVYYALAAGAKGLSYWWFSPGRACNGCGADDPDARKLWKEIGLLGAEVRTAGPVITTSCPAALDITAPSSAVVRALVSGTDTVAVIVVNDDVLCDRVGTVVKSLSRTSVKMKSPSWLHPAEAFEISCEGIKDVTWKNAGGEVAIDLGKLDVGRLVIVTSDKSLRGRLQKLYDEQFAENVKGLLEPQMNTD